MIAQKLQSCHIGDLAMMHGFHSSRRVSQYKRWIEDIHLDKILIELDIDLDAFDNRRLPVGVVWLLRRYVIALEDLGNAEIMEKKIEDFFPDYKKEPQKLQESPS